MFACGYTNLNIEYNLVIIMAVLVGFGSTGTFTAFTVPIQNNLPENKLAIVTSSLQFSRVFGISMGSALLGAILLMNMTSFNFEFPRSEIYNPDNISSLERINEIKDEYENQSAPGLLYQEENAMVRMIRDYYHENITEVVIDEPVAFQRALKFFQAHMPKDQKKLQLYLGEKSLFSSYDIEGHIEILHHKKVPLPSGGSLVIMPTEALVAIDVNSGRSTQERNIEDTALRTNLEAAEEVAKQLRLRNLGGLIVVDFIDMDLSLIHI